MPSPRPDLDAEAGPETIADSLRGHGCTVVRRLLPPQPLAVAAERVEKRFAQLDALAQGVYRNNLPIAFGDVSAETAELLGRRVDRPVLLAADRELSDREPHRFDHSLLRLIASSPAAAIARAYFGEAPVLAVGASRLRRQRAEQRPEGLPLHQDAGSGDYGSSVGLTVFFPLNGCGGDYPGLEVRPIRVTELLPRPAGEWHCEPAVAATFGPELWAPELRLGDAIVFDSFCPHRTFFGPTAGKERLSCDARLFSRAHAPRRLSAMIDVG